MTDTTTTATHADLCSIGEPHEIASCSFADAYAPIGADPTSTEADPAPSTSIEADPDTYVAAIEVYLAAADWLTLADAPFKIHARKLAVSLDKQLAAKGEVQSALASTFAKVLGDLDKRRPGPPPAPKPNPLVDGVGPHGEASIFGLGMD